MVNMIEKILTNFAATLGKNLDTQVSKKVKIPTVLIVLVGICAFFLGFGVGCAVGSSSAKKKIKTKTSADDDFDAEEYLRNLDLDLEDE